MTESITHRLLWNARYQNEHDAVMAECQRVSALGGSFQIKNEYSDNWYSIITINYPTEEERKC